MNLATRQWRAMYLDGMQVNRQQPGIDEVGRAVYFNYAPDLIKVYLDRPGNFQFDKIPLPAWWQPTQPSHEAYLTVDTKNRLVVAINNIDMGADIVAIGLYDPSAGTWTRIEVPSGMRANLWGFDENLGAIVGMGGEVQDPPIWLFKVK
jgi:hypothetical protein